MKRVSVIVPVYNAFDEAIACLQSIARHSEGIENVFVIDDRSPNGTFSEVLPAELRENSLFQFSRNEENLGYAGSCNHGIELAGHNDVILLNSDTLVTPHFATKLRRAAYSAENVASATPFTNRGDICSVPKFGVGNDLPESFELDEFAELIESVSLREYPELPTCVGHCVYLRRDALEKVGVFNRELFPVGYGEENDLACRFVAAGLKNVLDDATYIFHHAERSFEGKKWEIIEESSAKIQKLHPHYFDSVSRFCNRNPLRHIHLRILDRMAVVYAEKKPFRVLHILQNGPHVSRRDGLGGTELHAMDIIETERDVFHWSLVPTKRCYYLTAHLPGHEREYILDLGKTSLESILSPDFFEVIHLHHSRYYDHAEISTALQKHGNYLVSFHDYILSCPRFHLYTPFRKVCNGHECTDSCGYSQDYIKEYREHSRSLLLGARERISFSKSTQQYVNGILGEAFDWTEIPHGIVDARAKEQRAADVCLPRPEAGEALRVAFIGNIPQHKGSLIIEELIKKSQIGDTPIEWQVIGKLFLNAGDRVKDFGTYQRDELLEKIREANPHVVAILSICPETYCLTLDEAWNAGVPVISTHFGAPAERVRQSEAGWILPEMTAEKVLAVLECILADWGEYERAHAGLQNVSLRSIKQETDLYSQLYQQTADLAPESDSETLFQYLRGFGMERPRAVGLAGRVIGECVNKSIWILDSMQLRGHIQRAATSLLPARLIRELKSLR